jgi:molybdopterin-guanine dinucleotide biosynthesis protein A
MSFDPKCYTLAAHFLPDAFPPGRDAADATAQAALVQPLHAALAQHIQDAVEDWLAIEAHRLEAALRVAATGGRNV